MSRKYSFNRFGIPRRIKFHQYASILGNLPEYADIIKIIQNIRSKEQNQPVINYDNMEAEEEQRKQNWQQYIQPSSSDLIENDYQESLKKYKKSNKRSYVARQIAKIDPPLTQIHQKRSKRKRKPVNKQKQYEILTEVFPKKKPIKADRQQTRTIEPDVKRRDKLSLTLFNTIEQYFQ